MIRSKLNELLDEGGISERGFDIFYRSVLEFHRIAFIYAINNFPLQDELLQLTQFVNFYDKKCTFQSVIFVAEKLKLYINFSDQDLCQLETEFLSFQSITLDEMSEEALKEAAIHHEDHVVVYRINVLWYHLFLQKIPSTSRLIFHHLFNLVRVVSFIIPSKAEGDFSTCQEKFDPTACVFRIRWNSFKYSKLPVEPVSWRKMLSVQVLRKVVSRSKNVKHEYNQEHSSTSKSTR